MCAVLTGEPYHLTLEQIGNLDRWQVRGIYFCPREKGAVVATGATKKPTLKEGFYTFWRNKCLPRWRVDHLWAQCEREAREAREKRQAEARANRAKRK